MSNVSFLEDIEDRRIADLDASTISQRLPGKRRYVIDHRERQTEYRTASRFQEYHVSAAVQQPSSAYAVKPRLAHLMPLLRFEVWHLSGSNYTLLAQCRTEAKALNCAKRNCSRVARGDVVCAVDVHKRLILRRYLATRWTLPHGRICGAHYGIHRVNTKARMSRLGEKGTQLTGIRYGK